MVDMPPLGSIRKQAEERGPKAGNKVRDKPCPPPTARSPTRRLSCTIVTCAEGLVQSKANSLVVNSVSMIPDEPR